MSNANVRKRRYHAAEQPVAPALREAVDAALAVVAPIRRDKALPILQAMQARIGSLPAEAVAYASKQSRIPVAEFNALISFYDLLHADPQGDVVIHVCDDIVCRHAPGFQATVERLQQSGQTVHFAPCLGQCDHAPAALLTECGGERTHAYGGYARWSLEGGRTGAVGVSDGHEPRLLRRCGQYDPTDLRAYEACGGLAALTAARSLSPADVVGTVKATKLVGRGGAAFPTGVKWEGVLTAPTPLGPGPDGALKYVIVNADESEPGTFTNRLLMEQDPLGVVEAALIAAHAVRAQQVYIYIRGEYPRAIEAVTAAIETFRAGGLCGDVSAEVRCGAGAYVCGEETALFASIEGERGEPRVKPPFPTTNGVFNRPTLINNVETLHNLHSIFTEGPEAWNAVEPKLFSIAGHVARPGVYEVPMRTPLSALIALAGGPVGDIQAVLMGGASGMFIGPDQLDTPLEFKAMQAIGATLGSGAVMLYNDSVNLWETARRAAQFFAAESCGKCVPCRVGTARQVELVDRLAKGDVEWAPLHQELGGVMGDASICGLGHTATSAVRSLLRLKGVL